MRIILLVLLSAFLVMAPVRAQDDDVVIEEEASDAQEAAAQSEQGEAQDDAEGEEEVDSEMASSPDVELRYTFLQPAQATADVQLKANSRARLLVGFSNRGQKSFLVQGIDSSFRYGHDYNYILQNHTVRRYDRIVPGGHDASFDYSFHVHEFFAGRPFYLTAIIYYRGEDASSQFRSAVFNSTVKVEEEEAGFDAETFFMYLAFTAIIALLGVLVWQAMASATRRVVPKGSSRSAPSGVELGTEANRKDGDVDYQWISPHVLQNMSGAKRGKKGGAGSSSGSGSDSEGAASAGSGKATRRAAAATRKTGGSDNE